MIVGIIAVQTCEEVCTQVDAYASMVDVFEWRIDFLSSWDFQAIAAMRACFKKPLMLTLRSKEEGGKYQESEGQRLERLHQLASLAPEYLDVESSEPDEWISTLHARYPAIHLLRSFHARDHTPHNLDAILDHLYHPACQSYKVIGFAQSSLDTLRMLSWLNKNSQRHPLTAHCMGEKGFFSRVLSPVMGGLFQFVQLGSGPTPAPGCMSVHEAHDIYRLPQLNRSSRVYALMGHPVSHSIGHIYHNSAFADAHMNAVYVKIDVEPEQLSDFFEAIQELPFAGFSVTMPFKEDVMHYIEPDAGARVIGAVNTLRGREGINTDGDAVWAVLRHFKSLSPSTVLILGAGGSARAVACTARAHGVQHLFIVNRSHDSAAALATAVQGVHYDFETAKHIDLSTVDIIINTLPLALEELRFLFDHWNFSAKHILMTLRYDDPSFIAFRARFVGCALDGYLMFKEQARAQQEYWVAITPPLLP